MKNPLSYLSRLAKYLPVFILFLLATGVSYLYADVWSDPAGVAPGNNTSAPINVGSTTQSKIGNFTAQVIGANGFCLGGNCISSWPSGGSGGGGAGMDFITSQTLSSSSTTPDGYKIYNISSYVPSTATVAIVILSCAQSYGTAYSLNERMTSTSPSVNVCHVGFSHAEDVVEVAEQVFIPISGGLFQLGGSSYYPPVLMGYI